MYPYPLLLWVPLLLALAACGPHGGDSGAGSTAGVDGAAGASAAAGAAAAPGAAGASAATASTPPAQASAISSPIGHALDPLPGKESSAPALTRATRVLMKTTAGDVTIEVYPEAAPNAAQRFLELVRAGFYDHTPISRVVPGFVAQFGVNWRDPYKSWRDRNFDDDPSLFALERGTLAFAKGGPNTNSTQVFINYAENNRLADPRYNFAVFAKVVDGMVAVDHFVQVGDPSNGLDQARLWDDGQAYLDSLKRQPTMIESAAVLQ